MMTFEIGPAVNGTHIHITRSDGAYWVLALETAKNLQEALNSLMEELDQ